MALELLPGHDALHLLVHAALDQLLGVLGEPDQRCCKIMIFVQLIQDKFLPVAKPTGLVEAMSVCLSVSFCYESCLEAI